MNNPTPGLGSWSGAARHSFSWASSESWMLWVAVVVCVVLLAVVVVVALGLASRLHQKEPVTAPTKGARPRRKQKRGAAANSEWWTRTQWALEATLSENEMMNGYGLKMLRELAKSETAAPEEKELLDAVWQESCTRMGDDAIDQLIEAAKELKILSEPQKAPPRSADMDDRPESIRDAAKAPRKRYGPDGRDRVLSILRREILAAGLKVTLDRELGRSTSPQVMKLSLLEPPPLVRQVRSADDVGGDRRGPAPL
ncbi:hypothetical protein [Arthrobacter pityocampae]|uniref:hypothetical protein n=1 Tax=Arthrobacter pityocampae TaxID=547334 RepID=UPI0037352885